MTHLKTLGLAAVAVAAAAFAAVGTASATELTTTGGAMVTTGSTIAAKSEGKVILHPPVGDVECEGEVEGTTINTGSATETVEAEVSTLTFTNCGPTWTVTVLAKGRLIIHTRGTGANHNSTLTMTGSEITIFDAVTGIHCIFKTNTTDVGTLTGSATTGRRSTLDIEATIPRTGGRSGAFCGSTAQLTGSYEFNTPETLNVE